MYVKMRLDAEGQALYQRVADLLGPVGATALNDLAEVIWLEATDYMEDHA